MKELDPDKRMEMYRDDAAQFMESRAVRHAAAEQRGSRAGKGVSGLQGGPMPDYTRYAAITKA